MAYKYYQEIELEEHYPYAEEVARYLYECYGISRVTSNAPNTTMVAMLLAQAENATGEKPLFYNAKKGLRRVYPHAHQTIGIFLSRANTVLDGKIKTVNINNKNYRYRILNEENQ